MKSWWMLRYYFSLFKDFLQKRYTFTKSNRRHESNETQYPILSPTNTVILFFDFKIVLLIARIIRVRNLFFFVR